MKILIIGSAGFIGKAALEYFTAKDWDTWGCDITGTISDSNFLFINSEQPNYEKLFTEQQFDLCLNASGAANVGASMINPGVDFQLNTHNVFLMLNAIRKSNNHCKFLNLSSAAVYGNPESLPVTENQKPHPLSPYGWHKYMSEQICKEFYAVYGLPTFSLRIFSAYGPGLAKQLFWDLYQKSLSNKPIELFGSGNESRDFIFISDLLQAIDLTFSKADFNGGVMNVANGKEIHIEEAVSLFYKLLGNNTTYTFTSQKKAGDPDSWQADISNLLALGYKQKYIFEQGINEYVKWLKENE